MNDIHVVQSTSSSVPPSPLNRSATSSALENLYGVAVQTLPSPMHGRGPNSALAGSNLSSLGTTNAAPLLGALHLPTSCISNPQTARYMRTVRPRQLIVAVTANGAECGECGENGFDEICLKPLAKNEIYQIINRYFT